MEFFKSTFGRITISLNMLNMLNKHMDRFGICYGLYSIFIIKYPVFLGSWGPPLFFKLIKNLILIKLN